MAGERRAHHVFLDQPKVGDAPLVSVAVTLDQPGAFGDLERKVGREVSGVDYQGEPSLDRTLLLLVAEGLGAPRPQLGDQPQPQEARDALAVDLHAALERPAALFRYREQPARKVRRQQRADLVDAGLEELGDVQRLARL